jgi:hypothetical protein
MAVDYELGVLLLSQYSRRGKEGTGGFTTEMWYEMTPEAVRIFFDQENLLGDLRSTDKCLYPTQLTTGNLTTH